MRSFLYLVLLGVVLVTIAIVVRSGMLARKNPGLPINSAMRQAMESPQLEEKEVDPIVKKFGPVEKTASGLMYIVRQPGSGPVPAVGDIVTVHFDGRLLDGKPFDSSYARGEPRTFPVGKGTVIKAWDEALLTMRKGEKRTLIVPYWLGYGENARGRIPARATLVFELELLDVQPTAGVSP